jgi:aspartate aminotransferase/aminotransferase
MAGGASRLRWHKRNRNTMTNWIAERTKAFDSSGIRKVFDLAAKLKDPINLSIGQPDFEVPADVKQACSDAINDNRNGYSLTQGIPALQDKLQAKIAQQYGHSDRKLFVSSGTSGGLVLTMMCFVNPGDEVIIFDPYFVMYQPLVQLVGGKPVLLDTYPDFKVDVQKVESAITSKTKMILLNTPGNPTGATANAEEVKQLAQLAADKDILLVSDEIYSQFCYDEPLASPAKHNERTLVIDGFSKSHAMTGWRVGYVHGPSDLIDAMTKLQQYTFVCAPQPAQWASLVAMDVDVSNFMESYRGKRDRLIDGIKDLYDVQVPGGAFYVFPKAPYGTGTEFVSKAIENNLLIIPGNIFSQHDTHFRISYAASDEMIDRGIEALRKLAS